MHNSARLIVDIFYFLRWEIRNKMRETVIKPEFNLEKLLKTKTDICDLSHQAKSPFSYVLRIEKKWNCNHIIFQFIDFPCLFFALFLRRIPLILTILLYVNMTIPWSLWCPWNGPYGYYYIYPCVLTRNPAGWKIETTRIGLWRLLGPRIILFYFG